MSLTTPRTTTRSATLDPQEPPHTLDSNDPMTAEIGSQTREHSATEQKASEHPSGARQMNAQLAEQLAKEKANDDEPRPEPFYGRFALSSGAKWMALSGFALAAVAALVAIATFAPGSLALILGLFIVGFVGLYAILRGAFWPGGTPRSDLPWSAAFDTLPEALFITSRGGRLVFANQVYKDLLKSFGLKRELPLSRVLARDRSLGPTIYRLEVSARRGSAVREEITVAGPNGGLHYWTVEAKPLSSPTRYVMWRVTEQGAPFAEATTEPFVQDGIPAASAEVAQEDLSRFPFPALRLDTRNCVSEANEAVISLLGRSDESELVGSALNTLFGGLGSLPENQELRPGDNTLLAAHAKVALEGGSTTPMSLWQLVGAKGDAVVLCLDRIAPQDEVRLQVADTLAEIMGKAPIGIVVLNEDGTVVQANKAFEVLAGGKVEEGKLLEDLVETDSRDVIRTLIDHKSPATPSVHLPEIVFGDATPGGDSDARTASAFLAHVDEQGQCIILAIDVTQRKKLEWQFHQAQKMQTVGRLAGGIAHDFNNLLTAIIGFCDLLLTRHQVGDPSFADINQIRQNASRAASLTGQLLAFSRRQNLVPKVLNLTELLSDAAALLRRMLGEKIELNIVHARELGHIKADEGQITQVLTNLVVNARDAMQGNGKVTISTSMVGPDHMSALGYSYVVPGDFVMVKVEDTGSGIPEKVREQIFEPFFTTKALGEGTGLGLSTVYGIVKQTGGYIFVDSEEGVGTTFNIYLPVYEGTEEAANEKEEEALEDNDTTGQGVVLLVEDEAAVRAFSSRALNMRGYTVLEAEDGEDALRVLEDYDGTIDLVVSDVVMPGLDGPGLVERLRADSPELKVVFMSGYAEDSFRKQLEEAGGEVHFLPKPFSLPQLAGIVKKVIGTDAAKG